jgi:hypothetical protein
MPEAELFLLFARPLNRACIRYVISGSVAAIFYGEPRLPHDVDLICFFNESDLQPLPTVFPPDRFSFKVDLSLLSEGPRMDLFSSCKVEIRLKASLQVDDIEMTSLLAGHAPA